MTNISNYTKASIFFDDITDPTISVKKENGFTIQKFGYECSRNRNSMGMPYGPPLMTILNFTIKSLPDGYMKELYKKLAEHSASNFSIIFNATFHTNEDQYNILEEYEQAIIATGFVIDIKEIYNAMESHNANSQNSNIPSTTDLMMTDVQILLQSINYIGNNNYQKKLYINY